MPVCGKLESERGIIQYSKNTNNILLEEKAVDIAVHGKEPINLDIKT